MPTIPMDWVPAVGVCQPLYRKLRALPEPRGAGLTGRSVLMKYGPAPLFSDGQLREFYQWYIDNYDQAKVESARRRPGARSWESRPLETADAGGVACSSSEQACGAKGSTALGAPDCGTADFVIPSGERALTLKDTLPTRRKVQRGCGADFYGNRVTLAVQGELIEAMSLEVRKIARGCLLVKVSGAPCQLSPLSFPEEERLVVPDCLITWDGAGTAEQAADAFVAERTWLPLPKQHKVDNGRLACGRLSVCTGRLE